MFSTNPPLEGGYLKLSNLKNQGGFFFSIPSFGGRINKRKQSDKSGRFFSPDPPLEGG
jgi:hypothetical protein